VGVVVANNKGDNKSGQSSNYSSGAQSDNYGTSAEIEYYGVDEMIEFGDFDGMEKLSKRIQNGEVTGKVVKIEGFVSHPMDTYSIVQVNSDGLQKVGTQFIMDSDEASYPADGDHIIITGEVIEKEPMIFVIKTTPNNIGLQL
jgi:hypothetical protein